MKKILKWKNIALFVLAFLFSPSNLISFDGSSEISQKRISQSGATDSLEKLIPEKWRTVLDKKQKKLKKNLLVASMAPKYFIGNGMGFFQRILASISGHFASMPPQKIASGQCTETINGQMVIDGEKNSVTVSASTQINGQLKANNAIFLGLMEVNGQATCRKCTFNDDILIRGDGLLDTCSFAKNLEILSKKVIFRKCNAKIVYVTDPVSATSFFGQKVFLEDNTSIEEIVFSHPGGVVYCSKNSNVLKVKNGKVKSSK